MKTIVRVIFSLSLLISVNAFGQNMPPTISHIPDTALCPNSYNQYDTLHLPFIVNDDADSATLSITVTNSNTSLVQAYAVAPPHMLLIVLSSTSPGSATIIVKATDSGNLSASDTMVVTIYPLPSISAGPDEVVCANSTTQLQAAGGTSYTWTPASSLSCSVCPNPIANAIQSTTATVTYTVTGADQHGCINKDQIILSPKVPIVPDICMVTVDSQSTHNIVIWQKPVTTSIDSFRIYREDQTNVYTYIGSVAYSDSSVFHDYGANPNITSKRYKLSALDTCGYEGMLSEYHNTVFIADLGNGYFSWNLYSIENSSNPVNNYVLYRDDNSTGNWNVVAFTAGTQTMLSDPAYSNYPNGKWKVITLWGISCPSNFSSSQSNARLSATTGISSVNPPVNISVYPNPSNSNFTFSTEEPVQVSLLEIYNSIGERIYSARINSTTVVVEAQSWPAGIYYYNMQNTGASARGILMKK